MKKKEDVKERYRKVLKRKDLSDEQIEKMRKNLRLFALAIIEHLMEAKVNQIY